MNISFSFWTVFKLLCLIVFVQQIFTSAKYKYFDHKTFSSSRDTNLNEVEFPLTFNMKGRPGFDPEKLIEHGFADSFNFFTGTHFNNSFVGWAGHKRWAVGYVGVGISSVG
jgi:hypothetical protein